MLQQCTENLATGKQKTLFRSKSEYKEYVNCLKVCCLSYTNYTLIQTIACLRTVRLTTQIYPISCSFTEHLFQLMTEEKVSSQNPKQTLNKAYYKALFWSHGLLSLYISDMHLRYADYRVLPKKHKHFWITETIL